MKLLKSFSAIAVGCVMLASANAAFAAVSCDSTAKTLVDYTSGALPFAKISSQIPTKTLTVVDTIASGAEAVTGDKALWFANTDGNGKIVANRGIEVITLTNNAGLYKHVSFDMYVPNAGFHGNLRSAFSRYGTKDLTAANVGYFNEIQFNSAKKEGEYVTQVNFRDNVENTMGIARLKNGQWHTIDMFISERKTDFYADGVYYATTEGTEVNMAAGASYGFLGFQLLPGYDGIIYNDAENAGIYFDNIKVKEYNKADVEFCGTVEQTGKVLKVYFTEPVKEGQSLEDINLKITTSGQVCEYTSMALDDDVLTIVLDNTRSLERGTEYVVDFPDNFMSIKGKKLYSDVYFKANAYHLANVIDFEYDSTTNVYVADTEVVEDGVITSLTSAQGKVTRKENLQTAEADWMNAGLIGIKDFRNMYSDHGNVMALRYNAASGRGFKEVRSGLTILAGHEDLSKNSVSMEFDMMIPARENLEYFYFGPYSLVGSISASGAEVNHSGLMNGAFGAANTQYAHIIAPDRYNKSFNSRKDGVIEHRGSTTDSNANYDHSKAYANGEWCKVRIDIKKTGENTYETKFYIDNELVSTVTGMNQAQRTDVLRGLRFTYLPVNTLKNITNLVYIDNFEVSVTPDMAKVLRTRIYNRDGEEFGMLSDKVKATAPKVDIFFNGAVDAENAVVTLTDGEKTITSNVVFNSAENKITAELNDLLKVSTEYTVQVRGLKNAEGADLAPYDTRFTTSPEGEFEITLELTDAEGNVISGTEGLEAEDVVYVKSNVLNTTKEDVTIKYMAATYNDKRFENLGAKDIVVKSSTKLSLDKDSENPVSAVVGNTDKLEIGGFAWDSNTFKPLIEAVKY